jgi:sugar (pentulose or hexulose) kinase
MSCQSHLVDVRTGGPSSFIRRMGWQDLFPRRAKAWETIGSLKPEFRGSSFRGEGRILAGVHDSNGNFLRYLAAGLDKFTLLSTGTWIIGFDTEAKLDVLDERRDTVTSTNVFGSIVICCRFFGGYEFDVLSQHAPPEAASLDIVKDLIAAGTLALPSFADAGGPVPDTGNKGRIQGPAPEGAAALASLASLYCALMVSESLGAIGSRHDIIVDGPFSKNAVFLSLLARLRPGQRVLASDLRDGTTAGAACLALMPDGKLPKLPLSLAPAMPAPLDGLAEHQRRWRELAYSGR